MATNPFNARANGAHDVSAALRVLVAEDDVAVREALAALIRTQSDLMLVASVSDGPSAVAAAAAEAPDAAIVDVRMPGGGAWTVREIRRVSPLTGVIAFSGHNDPGTKAEMLEAGAGYYVVKGTSIVAILDAIRETATVASGPGGGSRTA